jgi:hypothetical protein
MEINWKNKKKLSNKNELKMKREGEKKFEKLRNEE